MLEGYQGHKTIIFYNQHKAISILNHYESIVLFVNSGKGRQLYT